MNIALLKVNVVTNTAFFFAESLRIFPKILPSRCMIRTVAVMIKRFQIAALSSSGVNLFSMLVTARAGAAIFTTVVENTLFVFSGHFCFFVKKKPTPSIMNTTRTLTIPFTMMTLLFSINCDNH